MAKVKSVHKIDVSTASFPVSMLLNSMVNTYKVYGSKTLSADVAIVPSGTPSEGMSVLIDYVAAISSPISGSRFGDYKLEIFGVKVPYSFLAKKLKIWCEYSNSAWSVFMLPSADSIPFIKLESIDPAILDDTTLTYDGTTGLFKIKTGGITNAMINASAAIAYTKLALTGAILNADLAGSIAWTKLLAGTAKRILGTNASTGVVEELSSATYPTTDELAYLKGVTSAIQTQLANRYTKTEADDITNALGVLIADTYTKAETDNLIAGVGSGVETYTTISGNTTLTAATIKQNIRIDATGGGVDITLPPANTLDEGYTTEWVVMGANAARLLRQGSDKIGDLTGAEVTALTITGAGNRVKTICDGSAAYYEA